MTKVPDRCRFVVCRGCCCGTTAKHPDFDHKAQVARLEATNSSLAVTGCLGSCDSSNNIVIIPSRSGRAAGGGVVWLGRMLAPHLTEAAARWVDAGGPGVADPPEELAAHLSRSPARVIATGLASATSKPA